MLADHNKPQYCRGNNDCSKSGCAVKQGYLVGKLCDKNLV